MTKKDLERRYRFLLLQLKIINGILKETAGLSSEEIMRHIGAAQYYAEPETIKKDFKNIEKFDAAYNFFNKTMDIKEYEE